MAKKIKQMEQQKAIQKLPIDIMIDFPYPQWYNTNKKHNELKNYLLQSQLSALL